MQLDTRQKFFDTLLGQWYRLLWGWEAWNLGLTCWSRSSGAWRARTRTHWKEHWMHCTRCALWVICWEVSLKDLPVVAREGSWCCFCEGSRWPHGLLSEGFSLQRCSNLWKPYSAPCHALDVIRVGLQKARQKFFEFLDHGKWKTLIKLELDLQICEDSPAQLERDVVGLLEKPSSVFIPRLLKLFKSPHADCKCIAIKTMNLLAGGMPAALAESIDM